MFVTWSVMQVCFFFTFLGGANIFRHMTLSLMIWHVQELLLANSCDNIFIKKFGDNEDLMNGKLLKAHIHVKFSPELLEHESRTKCQLKNDIKEIFKQMTTSCKVICWHKWVLNSNARHHFQEFEDGEKEEKKTEKKQYCNTFYILQTLYSALKNGNFQRMKFRSFFSAVYKPDNRGKKSAQELSMPAKSK